MFQEMMITVEWGTCLYTSADLEWSLNSMIVPFGTVHHFGHLGLLDDSSSSTLRGCLVL